MVLLLRQGVVLIEFVFFYDLLGPVGEFYHLDDLSLSNEIGIHVSIFRTSSQLYYSVSLYG